MSRKITIDEFIKRAKQTHEDNAYDYSLVNYVDIHTKVTIICNTCGNIFQQTPNNHIKGSGCPKCGITRRAKIRATPKEEFIEKAKKVHNDSYDYSKVNYKNTHTKVEIICNTCGNIFQQTPNKHLRGNGCPFCYGNVRLTTEEFIKRAKEIHKDKYDYSLVKYINSYTKVKIKCNICSNVFEQIPTNHLRGQGCRKCGIIKRAEFRTNSREEFIKKAKSIHKDNYDYSLVEYVNSSTKVKIKCNICGTIFEQTPNNHLRGQGCPECKLSKGEKAILNFLQKQNIDFTPQYKVNINNKRHYFDFYLPDYNVYIEYQGRQHFEPVDFFGGEKALLERQERDNEKREYCLNVGADLVEINYWDFENIEKILEERIIMKYGA